MVADCEHFEETSARSGPVRSTWHFYILLGAPGLFLAYRHFSQAAGTLFCHLNVGLCVSSYINYITQGALRDTHFPLPILVSFLHNARQVLRQFQAANKNNGFSDLESRGAGLSVRSRGGRGRSRYCG